MTDFLVEYYNWIKALHVISIIAWMAGLLYLPRLFVYHSKVAVGSDSDALFRTMEHKLLRLIMNPAMIASWIFGLVMLWAQPYLFEFGWMHAKLTLVVLMTILHMVFAKWRKGFIPEEGSSERIIKDEKIYRIWNEAPAVLMILIVILAIAEPF